MQHNEDLLEQLYQEFIREGTHEEKEAFKIFVRFYAEKLNIHKDKLDVIKYHLEGARANVERFKETHESIAFVRLSQSIQQALKVINNENEL